MQTANHQQRHDRTAGSDSEPLSDIARLAPSEIEHLWQRYFTDRDQVTRNALVELHLPLVNRVVWQLPSRLVHLLRAEELREMGVFGLISAVEHHRPQPHGELHSGAAFHVYATTRIRGAIFDELRRQDYLPRTIRREMTDYFAAKEEFYAAHRSEPTHEEILCQLGLTDPARVHDLNIALSKTRLVSLDEPIGQNLTKTRIDLIDPDFNQEAAIVERNTDEKLRHAVENLPKNKRTIIARRFFDESTQEEIGNIIGVSKTRVAQLEQSALRELRRSLEMAKVNERDAQHAVQAGHG